MRKRSAYGAAATGFLLYESVVHTERQRQQHDVVTKALSQDVMLLAFVPLLTYAPGSYL
ncbi:hypothetical protein [Lysinibacillus sp. G4S2]|uniref:hypothetical protein n=1 Tax=Lysinibacillus sp. G4S2 TaxID=3055859 RepID=UPI0025A1522F|nr:hypothetical protein [Lysinibacillus sp. G4S2]MDM5249967.1 hypothetical protein [Lysinibacillus sp. G4S2]